MLGFQVHDLAPNHSFDSARAVGYFADDGHARLSGTAQLRQHFISLGLQRIAGKDGDGFTEGFVTGGTAAPQIIVVERGKIVMNQRVGVEHFQGGTNLLDAVGQGAADHAPCFHTQDGTQALAAREHAVPHGLVDGRGMLSTGGQEPFERDVSGFPPLFQDLFQHGIAV